MTNPDTSTLIQEASARKQVHNFNAGPAVLPLPVLEQVQTELLDFRGTGMSLMEMSHRSSEFEGLMQQVEDDLFSLISIPREYQVLFLQGGASLQFAMLPMNLRPPGASADYLLNGVWGQTALREAKKLGAVRVVSTSESTNFDRLPAFSPEDLDAKAAYLHFTSNETIHGIEWKDEPTPVPGVPLICDISSNFLSRPFDITRYGLVYAGAQKNAGPAGVTIVIVRKDLLERVPANLPAMLDYRLQAEKGSMYNTPPTFSIYVVGLVLHWLRELGGLTEIERRNAIKSGLVYDAIDRSGGFYRPHAQADSRSRMNVTFRMETEELENQFARQAKANGLVGLKGHRSVGGLRASLYNALPVESAQVLAQFMQEFQRKNG
jgi:phosphoserine aminotransferase